MKKALAYQDVLLVPQYSEIMNRSDVKLSVNINKSIFNSPIIVANMRDLVNYNILEKSILSKNLIYMHRFCCFEDQVKIFEQLGTQYIDAFKYVGASLGVKKTDYENLKTLFELGLRNYVVDVAHGDHKLVVDFVRKVKEEYGSELLLVAGNVATSRAAKRLWKAGADVVKANVGSGSICSTRIQTGNGVPTFTTIMDIAKARKDCKENNPERNYYFIADGGIRSPGDVVKALCFADMVMVGNMFAGSIDTPGRLVNINGQDVKEYHGSSTHKTRNIEGYKGTVSLKPSFEDILKDVMDGVASGCSYQGVDNLNDLKDNPEFVEITPSGIIESGAHGIKL